MTYKDGLEIDVKDLPSYSLFSANPPEIIYHYTGYDSASSIVTNKSLWLTKLSFLNDTTELKLALNLLHNTLIQRAERTDDVCKKDFITQAAKQSESYSNINICVASFCEDGDLLSQWRGYGNTGKNLSLGFASEAFQILSTQNKMNLWKCVYKQADQRKIMEDFADRLDAAYEYISDTKETENWSENQATTLGYFYASFLRVAPVIKNHHFHEEKEWRLITRPISNRDKNFEAKVSSARSIKYYSLHFDEIKDDHPKYKFLKEVTIGPTSDPSQIGDALSLLMEKHNYKNHMIRHSFIPYRPS